MQTNGYLAAWRTAFAAIAANIIFSIGADFIGIENIQISSLISTAAFTVFAVCLALFFSRRDINAGFSEIGFRGFNPRILPFLILIPVSSQFFCSFMTLPLSGLFRILFGFDITDDLLAPNGAAEAVIAFLYLCVLAPISEEIVFRGVIYKYFERRSTLTAIFLSAAVFAAAHLDIRSFIPIFFIGMTLGLFRFVTGSLFATMIAHSAVNIFALFTMSVEIPQLAYAALSLVLAVAFPFIMYAFLRRTMFPPLKREGSGGGASVFLILICVIFLVFQGIMLVNNIVSVLHGGSEFFQEFGGFDERLPDEFNFGISE